MSRNGAITAPLHRLAFRAAHALRKRWWRWRKPLLLGCRVLAFDEAGRARAVATLQAGGHGRASLFAGSVALGLLYLHGRPLLSALPLPVLAGTMLVIALKLIDSWSSRLLAQWWAGERSRDLWLSLGVVALVFATTIWRGFAAGVALGLLLKSSVVPRR